MAIAKIFRNYAAFIIMGMKEELRIIILNFFCGLSSVVTTSQVPNRISPRIKNILFYIHPKGNEEIDNNRRTDCSKR